MQTRFARCLWLRSSATEFMMTDYFPSTMASMIQGWARWIKNLDASHAKEVRLSSYFNIYRIAQADCPGHFGHIELARPVFHAGLIEYIRKVLRCACFNCFRLLASKEVIEKECISKIKNAKTRFTRVLAICDKIHECD
jgi:hypothetical protein